MNLYIQYLSRSISLVARERANGKAYLDRDAYRMGFDWGVAGRFDRRDWQFSSDGYNQCIQDGYDDGVAFARSQEGGQ